MSDETRPISCVVKIPEPAEGGVSLLDTIAIAVITSTPGGWLKDDGAMRELARRAYVMAKVMLEERERA